MDTSNRTTFGLKSAQTLRVALLDGSGATYIFPGVAAGNWTAASGRDPQGSLTGLQIANQKPPRWGRITCPVSGESILHGGVLIGVGLSKDVFDEQTEASVHALTPPRGHLDHWSLDGGGRLWRVHPPHGVVPRFFLRHTPQGIASIELLCQEEPARESCAAYSA